MDFGMKLNLIQMDHQRQVKKKFYLGNKNLLFKNIDDICPRGEILGEFKDNIAHSNVRFGLRILEMAARKYPC